MKKDASIYSSVFLTLLVGSISHYTRQENLNYEMQSRLTVECRRLIKMSFRITWQN